jgi:hypothetical protein
MAGPEQSRDELSGGSSREPLRPPRWVQLVALLAVVLVGGAVALSRAGSDADSGGGTPSSRRPADGAPGGTPPGLVVGAGTPPLTGPLLAPDLCVSTDQRTLTVRFTVRNGSLSRVTVLEVAGRLPIGGLVAAGVRLPASRTCPGVTGAGTDLVLEPGDEVPVALRFRLPPDCPAPYPVFADVSFVGRGETPMTQQLPLLADLGGYDFTSCER